MDDDVDLRGGRAEEPVRFDDFEPLVHQRRRVDRDLRPHLPRRMLQRVCRRHVRRAPPDCARETVRPTPSGSDVAARRLRARADTGGWRCARCRPGRIATPCRRAASITSPPAITSTSLLARPMVLPASIAASTASSAAVPDDAHSTKSTIGMRRDGDESVAPGAVAGRQRPAQPRRATRRAQRRRHRDGPRAIASDLRGEQIDVAAGGEAHDLDTVGMRIDHRERARADRARRTENGDALRILLGLARE